LCARERDRETQREGACVCDERYDSILLWESGILALCSVGSLPEICVS